MSEYWKSGVHWPIFPWARQSVEWRWWNMFLNFATCRIRLGDRWENRLNLKPNRESQGSALKCFCGFSVFVLFKIFPTFWTPLLFFWFYKIIKVIALFLFAFFSVFTFSLPTLGELIIHYSINQLNDLDIMSTLYGAGFLCAFDNIKGGLFFLAPN